MTNKHYWITTNFVGTSLYVKGTSENRVSILDNVFRSHPPHGHRKPVAVRGNDFDLTTTASYDKMTAKGAHTLPHLIQLRQLAHHPSRIREGNQLHHKVKSSSFQIVIKHSYLCRNINKICVFSEELQSLEVNRVLILLDTPCKNWGSFCLGPIDWQHQTQRQTTIQ